MLSMLMLIDPDMFERCFRAWIRVAPGAGTRALDGKGVRTGADRHAIAVVRRNQ